MQWGRAQWRRVKGAPAQQAKELVLEDRKALLKNAPMVALFLEEGMKRKFSFREELKDLLNKHSRENESNTPDAVLADYLMECLSAFDKATNRRTYLLENKTLTDEIYLGETSMSDIERRNLELRLGGHYEKGGPFGH